MTLQEGSGFINKPGSKRLSAKKLNQFERRVLQGTRTSPGQVSKSNQFGVVSRELASTDIRQTASASSSEVMELVRVEGDYLVCKRIDGTGRGIGEEVKVAKPYLLRKSTFDGKTIGNVIFYAYSSDGTFRMVRSAQPQMTFTQSERIDPPYIIVGLKNYVVGAAVSHTGLVVGEAEVQYIDLNIEPREWRAAY
jgi:hypothetical protein